MNQTIVAIFAVTIILAGAMFFNISGVKDIVLLGVGGLVGVMGTELHSKIKERDIAEGKK